MAYLVDMNVFLRLVSRNDPDRQTVLDAFRSLTARNDELVYTSQVLAEFWTVCTRPSTARGGYGLSPEARDRKARMIERYCRFLPDSIATHQEWRRLIVAHSVMGVEVYDARLVASMNVPGIAGLLTFDSKDFKRYPGILVLSPENAQCRTVDHCEKLLDCVHLAKNKRRAVLGYTVSLRHRREDHITWLHSPDYFL
jgi:predicted nucleic acid-binding protein